MFLDTSGLFTLLDASSALQPFAQSVMNKARSCFAHSYVLTELLPLGQARRFNRERLLQFAEDVTHDPGIRVVWVTRDDHLAAMDLLTARRDKRYSLCDAVSFILMRRFNVTDALTTDHHFEQEGFVRLLRP